MRARAKARDYIGNQADPKNVVAGFSPRPHFPVAPGFSYKQYADGRLFVDGLDGLRQQFPHAED